MEQDFFKTDKNKYFMDHNHMISMNGKSNKFTNFMHAYNTWLNYFWADYISGAFWAQDQFLMEDVGITNNLLIKLFNGSEDEINISILSFINGLKPTQNFIRSKNYTYPNRMTFYDDNCDEIGYHPVQLFHKIMELVQHQSVKELVEKELNKAGLPYVNIIRM